MNHKIGKVVLLAGLGLSTLAVSASASSINWALGLQVQTSGYGYQPSIANVEAVYNSSNAAPNGSFPAGVTYTQNDPAASLSYSPNPSLSLGGLTGGSLSITGSGGSAAASASLASGATHISGSSGYSLTTSDADQIGVNMSDQLTFSGSGAITIGFSLDGSTSVLGAASPVGYDPSNYSQTVNLAITGTGTAAFIEWGGTVNGADPKTGTPTFADTTSGTQGWSNGGGSGVYTSAAYNGFAFVGTLAVTDGEVLNLDLIQSMNCNDGATCSYQNTGQLSLIDPNGVSYTSNSGVFLTQTSTSTTPEPSSLILIGSGLAAIGCARRRRSVR